MWVEVGVKVGVEVGVRVRVEVGVGYLRFYVSSEKCHNSRK